MPDQEITSDPETFQQLWDKDISVQLIKDRPFNIGDTILIHELFYSQTEINLRGRPIKFTGRAILMEITDKIMDKNKYGLINNWCLIALDIIKQIHNYKLGGNPDDEDITAYWAAIGG